jgi:hypothetical protein
MYREEVDLMIGFKSTSFVLCVFILLHFVLLEKITFRFIRASHFVLPDLDYYIYLVDYNKINEEDYVPTMIQDPYQEVFMQGKWSFSVDSYLVEEKKC